MIYNPGTRKIYTMRTKFCISIMLILTLVASGEVLPQKEQTFIKLLNLRSQKSAELANIELRLSQLADRIDSAKSAIPKDENLIRSLMASGIPVSDSLALGKSAIKNIDNQITELQNALLRLYKEELDSLRNLLDESNGDEKIVLKNRLELLNPAIRQLSFNPAKLQEIDLSDIKDPIEQDILSAFLRKSLLEVEERIEHIRNDLQEIEPFVKLNVKTREFLEEVDGDNFLLLGNSESDFASFNELSTNRDPGNDVVAASFIEQNAFSIELLMTQLEITDFNLESSIDSEGNILQPRFSSEDYVNLLREIEDQLKSVRSEIRGRLEEVDP